MTVGVRPERLELGAGTETSAPATGTAISGALHITKKPAVTRSNGAANKLDATDRAFHDWYRFVLSFPPHLVREYFAKFELEAGQCVLDPFCGTGTTLVEAKQHGFNGVGIEANSMAYLASATKTNWQIGGEQLLREATRLATLASNRIARAQKRRVLPDEQKLLLLTNSICEVPLHKALILREVIDEECAPAIRDVARLALAKTLVFSASNLHFGPEVGVRGRKEDADVVGAWQLNMRQMAQDLLAAARPFPDTLIHHADSRSLATLLQPDSIDVVFTSPPYPNEKDYTRTTRLESVLLGFVTSKEELRRLKKGLLRSNTRGVYKGDDDDRWVANNANIQAIADAIERRRIELKKDSGFEKQYAKVTKLYFGGMAKHLAALRPFLKKGAHLGYVVGDQASYLRVMIQTGQLLAEIASGLGYEVVSLDLFRTRIATATKLQMREEVLVLRWPGKKA